MAQFDLLLPKMGESVAEATILKWLKKEGDKVEIDEPILEIATDKVDSEVPSPVAGIISKHLFAEGSVAQVGAIIAQINTDANASVSPSPAAAPAPVTQAAAVAPVVTSVPVAFSNGPLPKSSGNKFYSPLVRSIAQQEGVPVTELEVISGSGMNGRVTKNDLLSHISNRGTAPVAIAPASAPAPALTKPAVTSQPAVSVSGNVEIIEMDRMRKLIADHMVMSKHTSPHVSSFVEADVTNIVLWREKIKKSFEKREGEKLTFTPIFIEAVAKAIKDYPYINASVDGTRVIVKKDINIGMAAALPSGNLIVPVIKNADRMNLMGITKTVNDLAGRARINKLQPDEIQGGTFTISNVGTFGNVMGTPIINQPQVAILAVGTIKKKPAVIETPYGDTIGIRHMMFLSLSYDHRWVDGSLGGSFLRRIADYLEQFDINTTI